MRYITFTIVLFLFSISAHSQIVTFEDDNFKSYLISLGIDINTDGEIQNTEAEAVETLHIDGSGAISLGGIQSFVNLVSLSSIDDMIQFIDISNMSALESIRIDTEWNSTLQLIAQNCTSLLSIDKYNDRFELDILDLSGCSALEEIIFDSGSIANNLILNDCINLKTLAILDGIGFTQKIELINCNSLISINMNASFEVLDVSGLLALESIIVNGDLNSLICQDMPSLKQLTIEGGLWDNFTLDNCPVINSINIIAYGNLDGFELDNLPELTTLILDGVGTYGNTKITNCQKLIELELNFGPVDTLDLTGCTMLTEISPNSFIDAMAMIFKDCRSIVELDLTGSSSLYNTIDLSGMISLTNISFFDCPEVVNLEGCFNLETFNVSDFTWTRSIDFSGCPKLKEVNLGDALDLETLILKNGSKETLQIQEALSLSEVCVDPDELIATISLMIAIGVVDVNITSNCDFANTGLPFQIYGKSILDVNGDDCATSTQQLPFTKYSISDELGGEGYFFANIEGDYRFYLPEGSYTYKPEVLYGNDLFTLSPLEQIASFPTDGFEVNQDFCFRPGLPIDIIEVTLIPLEPARPGFDARYLITYTNIGNVTRGGDIKLDFQDDRMDLIDAIPMADVQEENFISWAFEDLIPYETRSIEFTMNLNSPMETPPLNGGDILDFQAMIGPLGNQTVSSYWSNLKQEIVNSFDPNDKTCLNGDILEPSMIGDFLKYMIRFENTGSAEAVNIVVTDSIDGSKFDIRTLEVLNSSHNVAVDIAGTVVDFVFKDIYLPFEDASNDGYVTFKIKTWPDLVLGDDLRNKAEIYFDFNFPIITNTTSTVVTDLSSTIETIPVDINIEISPNPFIDYIDIVSSENISKIEMYTTDGRLINAIGYTDKKSDRRINLQSLNAGHYFLRIFNQDRYSIEKIIKL